jgi:NADH dehydrogenase/NADH:ubiquinone oxidoreductase subunit G
MAEAKIFPMNTFVSCLKGTQAADSSLIELLSFLTQNEVDAEFAPIAAALSKAWIYEQEPTLTQAAAGDISALGEKVAVKPLPDAALAQAQAILTKMAELRAANAALSAQVEKLTKDAADKADEVKALKAKLKPLEDQANQGDVKLQVSNSKMDEHIKKLEQLMEEVAKVKAQGVVVAGVAGGGAAAADAGAAAGGDASGAPAVGGEPEADFGLGSNPFADANW